MHISPSGSPAVSPSTATQADVSGEYANNALAALPTLSSIHNISPSAPLREPPTYAEAMRGTDRIVMQGRLNDLPHYVGPSAGPLSGKAQLIGQWESAKWESLVADMRGFADSSIAKESGFSAQRMDGAARAIATYTSVVTRPPDATKKSDPYRVTLGEANTQALNELVSLHGELLAHVEQMEPFNPSYKAHFVEFADAIDKFIDHMWPAPDGDGRSAADAGGLSG